MNKLKYIRVQEQDNSYSNDIPIGVDAQNVDMQNGNTLQDTIGNLDITIDDNITEQLFQLHQDINQLDTNKLNKSDVNNYVPSVVTGWLQDNVIIPTGGVVTIDPSLSTGGSAADAKVVGDKITDLKETLKYGFQQGYWSDPTTVTRASNLVSNAELINLPANSRLIISAGSWYVRAYYDSAADTLSLCNMLADGVNTTDYINANTVTIEPVSYDRRIALRITNGAAGQGTAISYTDVKIGLFIDSKATGYKFENMLVKNGVWQTNLPSLDDCVKNVIASIVKIEAMTITGWPDGFSGSDILFINSCAYPGIHTLGDTQWIINKNGDIATRVYGSSSWNAWTKKISSRSVILTVDGNNFAAKIAEANTVSSGTEVTIIVKAGVHDLAVELASYFESMPIEDVSTATKCLLTRDCTIVFESGAKVVCHYTGNNANVMEGFSPITAYNGSLTLINACIEASKVRYCVHDEHNRNYINPYTNRYINCQMSLDNTENSAWTSVTNCIGNGLGGHGYIVVDGGIYNATSHSASDKASIRFHNSMGASDAESHIIVKNVYTNKTVGSFSYGNSTKQTIIEVTNCHLAEAVQEGYSGGSSLKNMTVVAWNNEIVS